MSTLPRKVYTKAHAVALSIFLPTVSTFSGRAAVGFLHGSGSTWIGFYMDRGVSGEVNSEKIFPDFEQFSDAEDEPQIITSSVGAAGCMTVLAVEVFCPLLSWRTRKNRRKTQEKEEKHRKKKKNTGKRRKTQETQREAVCCASGTDRLIYGPQCI
ncbi:hypothetical protein BKA91DRAFT_49609 [Yarrowia lipolytica]|nr:hypothetical protein BKA91DRAFT_49609 [Yarrowia lipolytica]KAE8169661.1 hypothetical protein BKA90DRAFT_46535 [Yarrowia lipolytica]RMI97246.1 hypothetical protein BD777DRAFT_43767 [Yarrowia lipolytica]